MKIGIDFDNTIACYDNSFYEVALKEKWINSSTKPNKQSVKQSMHRKKMFDEFTILQGLVYGKEILRVCEDDICFSAAKLFFAYGLGNGMTFPLWSGAKCILFSLYRSKVCREVGFALIPTTEWLT